MTTFTIDADHNITAYANAGEAKQGDAAGVIPFDSQTALAKLSADWPLSRLVEIWNGILPPRLRETALLPCISPQAGYKLRRSRAAALLALFAAATRTRFVPA